MRRVFADMEEATAALEDKKVESDVITAILQAIKNTNRIEDYAKNQVRNVAALLVLFHRILHADQGTRTGPVPEASLLNDLFANNTAFWQAWSGQITDDDLFHMQEQLAQLSPDFVWEAISSVLNIRNDSLSMRLDRWLHYGQYMDKYVSLIPRYCTATQERSHGEMAFR